MGPFPKTRRWREIVAQAGGTYTQADDMIAVMRQRLANLTADEQAIRATKFFADIVVGSRSTALHEFVLGLHAPGSTSLREILTKILSIDSVVARAALDAFDRIEEQLAMQPVALEEPTGVHKWRQFDGSAFCDLARHFFACLLEELLSYTMRCNQLHVPHELIRRHAWEMSLITRSFSARWFNKCAVGQVPDRGSVHWYLGHCLGKLDMELERELSTHVELPPNPSRRKRIEAPSLGLGI